jgi:hypothetical protein
MVALITSLFSGWTPAQKVLWGTYTMSWLVDFGQTRHIAENPDRYWEDTSAWLIGEHPSIGTVNNFFIAQYALNYLIADRLGKSRGWYLGLFTAIHTKCAMGNAAIGIKIDL